MYHLQCAFTGLRLFCLRNGVTRLPSHGVPSVVQDNMAKEPFRIHLRKTNFWPFPSRTSDHEMLSICSFITGFPIRLMSFAHRFIFCLLMIRQSGGELTFHCPANTIAHDRPLSTLGTNTRLILPSSGSRINIYFERLVHREIGSSSPRYHD